MNMTTGIITQPHHTMIIIIKTNTRMLTPLDQDGDVNKKCETDAAVSVTDVESIVEKLPECLSPTEEQYRTTIILQLTQVSLI